MFWGEPTKSEPEFSLDSRYNCFIPHGYDSVRVQQLWQMLSGPGGHVEQTFVYLGIEAPSPI